MACALLCTGMMQKWLGWGGIFCLLGILSGCAQWSGQTADRAPRGHTTPLVTTTAHHWQVLAQKIAEQIARDHAEYQEAVFLESVPSGNPFLENFRRLLTAELLARGITVRKNNLDALVLRSAVSVFVKGHDRAAEVVVYVELVREEEIISSLSALQFVEPSEVFFYHSPEQDGVSVNYQMVDQ